MSPSLDIRYYTADNFPPMQWAECSAKLCALHCPVKTRGRPAKFVRNAGKLVHMREGQPQITARYILPCTPPALIRHIDTFCGSHLPQHDLHLPFRCITA
jgi:hypothetical protein